MLVSQVLYSWGRYGFNTERVHKVIEDMKLTDAQIHLVSEFDMMAMLKHLLAHNFKPKETYDALRKKHGRHSKKLHRGRISPTNDMVSSREWEALTYVARAGHMDREMLIYAMALSQEEYINLRGLSCRHMLTVVANGAVAPLSPTEYDTFEEEYDKMYINFSDECASCDATVHIHNMGDCSVSGCDGQLCASCVDESKACSYHK